MAVVLAVARAVGYLFRRMRQPAVIGEIVAGILLGPSVLGQIPTGRGYTTTQWIFPIHIRPFLKEFAELGLIIFMFVVGLEASARDRTKGGGGGGP
jgi:Kef-type K+ transport system membrane component KefB